MIRLAAPDDTTEIASLIGSAIREMNRNNIDQWDCIYPDAAVIENDIRSGSLYKYEDGGRIAAIAAINNQGSPEYDEIQWSDTSNDYAVVHRLTVLPPCQGRGIAKRLMKFCEEWALQNGKSSIRLDAFANNPAACDLYRRLGYVEKGTVKFRKGTFYCFEKAIRGIGAHEPGPPK